MFRFIYKTSTFWTVSLVLITACLLMNSCKKDDLGLLGEVSKEFSNYRSSNIGKSVAMQLGDLAVNNRTIVAPGLPVLLNDAAAGDIVVEGKIDPSLISIYDELNHSISPELDAGAFELANSGKITVKSGLSQSQDSLKVLLKNASTLKNNTVYLIPIKLQVVSGNASLKSRYMFVKMHVAVTPIHISMGTFKFESGFSQMYIRNFSCIAGSIYNTQINGVDDGIKLIKFSAATNHPVDREVFGGIKINKADSIKTWFEDATFNKYKRMPDEGLKFVNRITRIAKNDSVSVDSFAVQIDYQKLQASDSTYLMVLELENESNKDFVNPNQELRANYAFITVRHTVLNTENIVYPIPDLNGTLINRSKWKAEARVTEDNQPYPAKNLLDGNPETFWKGTGELPEEVTLDLGQTETLKGFIFTPQYDDTYNDFQRTEVYSSSDGKSWIKQGLFIANAVNWMSTIENPDIKNLKFVIPVSSRYFKFKIISSSQSSPAIAEIQGVK